MGFGHFECLCFYIPEVVLDLCFQLLKIVGLNFRFDILFKVNEKGLFHFR